MSVERPARILPTIVLSQFAGTSLWFAGNAVLPDLQRELGLRGDAVATITSAVQLGFIAGTLVFAALAIADRFLPSRVFLACALLGAVANALVIATPGLAEPYPAILALRFATGFFLAGIYPVGMRIAAGWYREGLGNALGWLVGALVLGTALPHLLRGLGESMPWSAVLASLSLIAAAGGAAMIGWVDDGPYGAKGSKFDPRAVLQIFASRDLRASAFGYFGHMWELYTFWAFVPLLLAGYAAKSGATLNVPAWSFAIIAAGAIGCVAGGYASRTQGSAKVAFVQLSFSGACCLASPLAFLLPAPAFLAFLFAWGIFVVGDSPQFSALNAANAPRAMVGSTLTLINCIGFAITIPSIALVSHLASTLPLEWGFVPVAIGPLTGLLATRRLLR